MNNLHSASERTAPNRPATGILFCTRFLFLVIAATLPIAGCDRGPSSAENSGASSNASGTPNEAYDLIFLQGKPIGFAYTTLSTVATENGDAEECTQVTVLDVVRFGEPMQQTMTATSRQLTGGGLEQASFSMEGMGSQTLTKVVPEADGRRLSLISQQTGTTPSTSIAEPPREIEWDPKYGGFFALEHSLRHAPMQPGESRVVHGLMPVVNTLATYSLKAEQIETVDFSELGQSTSAPPRSLLKINSEVKFEGAAAMHVTLWTDDHGSVWKQIFHELSQTAIRTDEITAKAMATGSFDLGVLATVKLERANDSERGFHPHSAKKATYEIRPCNDAMNPSRSDSLAFSHVSSNWPSGAYQQVSETNGVVTVYVRGTAVAVAAGSNEHVVSEKSRQAALAVSSLVPHDNPAILRLADEATSELQSHLGDEKGETAEANEADEVRSRTIAVHLERFVRDYIEKKDYSQLLCNACEVANSKCGDCTEHAVLLAALCRAKGIPTRAAIGLVYVPTVDGFVFHMWNESLIGNRWTPLDATLGMGGIGAGHIAIATSDLSDGTAMGDFLPVAQLVGRIQIKLVDAK